MNLFVRIRFLKKMDWKVYLIGEIKGFLKTTLGALIAFIFVLAEFLPQEGQIIRL